MRTRTLLVSGEWSMVNGFPNFQISYCPSISSFLISLFIILHFLPSLQHSIFIIHYSKFILPPFPLLLTLHFSRAGFFSFRLQLELLVFLLLL
jgi:hypothetical protein